MSEDWKKYEAEVHEIFQYMSNRLVEKYQAKIIDSNSGRNNKIKGASGFDHQIDVHLKYLNPQGNKILIIGECKLNFKVKVGLHMVLQLFGRLVDIQNYYGNELKVFGNIFTQIGYTKPALKFAQHYKIATNTKQSGQDQWSITMPEEIIIKTAPFKLSSEGQRAIIKNPPPKKYQTIKEGSYSGNIRKTMPVLRHFLRKNPVYTNGLKSPIYPNFRL